MTGSKLLPETPRPAEAADVLQRPDVQKFLTEMSEFLVSMKGKAVSTLTPAEQLKFADLVMLLNTLHAGIVDSQGEVSGTPLLRSKE
jgi:hypothetical protein